ncbi:hypothetical protein BJY52DRAFT_1421102 [Lactarius psammicola]|nr:hypothetical protein BJY52DRAFT_1421102 [Lactarius psammicola]
MDAPRQSSYPDPFGPILSLYTSRARHLDDETVDHWKGGADSVLVFTGVFSSTVATFIAMSYPNLQRDPNVTTQSLLAQISQQLSSATTNGTSPTPSPPIQSSFSPSAPVVFINSVWFLSLVLGLSCTLIASLMQQWARRYRQIIQRNHAPHDRARIQEYFSGAARKFRIFEIVDALTFLLAVSVFLFFAGLVVFAFLANRIVAYTILATVGFCTLSYIALTLMPFIFHDFPYYTPFTPVLWFFAQIITFPFYSVLYRVATQSHDHWGTFSESAVSSFRRWYDNKAESLSEGMLYKLENSAKRFSMDLYKQILVSTLSRLGEDRELEEFVDGIPGLRMSEILTRDDGDTQGTTYDVLATLPGPTGFDPSLPWSIIQLARRAFTSKLSESARKQRTRACLRALYYIPGAIHDLLATYAAGKHYCLEILPLLNSPESLEVIDELWDTPNYDAALSVRCAAAVVTAFMITPPRRTLDYFANPDVRFIWDDKTGKQFLAKRLRIGADDADGDGISESYLRDDSASLHNIARFLTDIKDSLRDMNTQWWTSDNVDKIREQRLGLYNTRHTKKYHEGTGTFDRQGEVESPAFVPAAQQDLITLTLEILARGPVANAEASQRDAFRDAWAKFMQATLTEALEQAGELTLGQARERARAQMRAPQDSVLWALARLRVHATGSFGAVKHALEPVLKSLGPTVDIPTHGDTSGVLMAR